MAWLVLFRGRGLPAATRQASAIALLAGLQFMMVASVLMWVCILARVRPHVSVSASLGVMLALQAIAQVLLGGSAWKQRARERASEDESHATALRRRARVAWAASVLFVIVSFLVFDASGLRDSVGAQAGQMGSRPSP